MALFVPLDASYDQDPKILDLDDERAELLFIRSLAYSKRHLHDGMIHRRAIATFAPFMDDVKPATLAAELVRVGLWIEHPKGWRIAAWLKRNPGSEEILTPSKGRELAHQRHHVKTGSPKEGCPFCFPGAPVDNDEDMQVNTHDAVRGCDADAVWAAQHALPEPEPEPEPYTLLKSENHSDRDPEPISELRDEQQPPDEQTIRKTASLIGRHVAGTQAGIGNPAAYAAKVTRDILEAPDGLDRQRITRMLDEGQDPEAIAEAWSTDPFGLDLGHAPAGGGPDLKALYEANAERTRAQLANQHRDPPEATADSRAAARAALRGAAT